MRHASPADLSPVPEAEAPRDCPLCPRLVALRQACRAEHPDWWNAPVPAFGDRNTWLAIVGLAPGKHGANRTGRPFTGDYAGDLLYATLLKFGLAEGEYRGDAADGLQLKGAVILNAVKCLPPQNKTLPIEETNCRPFLMKAIDSLPNLRTFIALGKVAHDSLCRSFGVPAVRAKFAHGAEHQLPGGRTLIDSYHCSRYNQNTRRLDAAMFEAVFDRVIERRVAEEIRTDRLLLRRARYDDARAMHGIMSDAQAMRYWSSLPHETLGQTENWVASMVEADTADSDDFIVMLGDELIGKLGGWRLPEIGFLFAPSHWGHGYAGEAMAAFVERRRKLGSTELTADVDPRNAGALKLLVRSGFQEVGRAERTFQLGSEWCDSIYLRLNLQR